MEKSLTEGSVFKNLIRFSLPFLFSYFLQTLYGLADLFITGQFNDSSVITAVSIGSQLMHMLTVIIVGLAMGTTVLIGHAKGAGDSSRISSLTKTTAVLFFAAAVLFTGILTLLCPQIVSVMSTPDESVYETSRYLYICFLGIPFITAYNVIASVFRGKGDSKHPMYFVTVACVMNIFLDYIFIGKLSLKASGAAYATIISQLFSVIISLTWIFAGKRRSEKSAARQPVEKTRPSLKEALEILKIGFPVACQDGFIQISFLFITILTNRRGVDTAAAVGIVEKIITFLFLVPSSMLSAVSAISSQNLGAAKPERAKKTLFYGMAVSLSFGLIFALLFQFAGREIISLFAKTGSDLENVKTLGNQYIRTYVFDCVFASIHFCFSGYFCSLGKSILSFIHNSISIVLVRIPFAYIACRFFTESLLPLGLAATSGSLLSSIICFGIFIHLERRNKLYA